MNWLDPLAVQLASAAALLGMLGAAWHKGIRPVSEALWSFVRKLVHAVDVLDSLSGRLDDIEKAVPVWLDIAEEFKPDGGTTLVDRITRLEVGQRNITQQLEQHLTRDPASRTRCTDPHFEPPAGAAV